MAILSGWDQSMAPAERLYMVNWLLGQVTYVRHFLQQRSYNASDSAEYFYLGALQTDPSTPPAGTNKWSTVTTSTGYHALFQVLGTTQRVHGGLRRQWGYTALEGQPKGGKRLPHPCHPRPRLSSRESWSFLSVSFSRP